MTLSCPEQSKAARALLRWSQADLAEKSGVSEATVKKIERGTSPLRLTLASVTSLSLTLSNAGIEFLNDENTIGVLFTLPGPDELQKLKKQFLEAESLEEEEAILEKIASL